MKTTSWLILSLLLPTSSGTETQTQDIHTLRIVTQAFEKAKKDNKVRQDNIVSQKVHLIENLNPDGKFKSVEKEAVFKIYMKRDKSTEELVNVWPSNTEPPKSPVDFDKLLDAFLSRFYFLLSQDREELDSRKYYKIHFWPKEDLPSEKEYGDYILNRIAGVIYIDEKTYMVQRIDASLSQSIHEGNIFWSFIMDRFDFKVVFLEWHGLGLPESITATARYSYRKGFFPTKRFQAHRLTYKYGPSK